MLRSQDRERRRRSFLDIGTGSGILAIAAAKLGYSAGSTHLILIPKRCGLHAANARVNRVAGKIRFWRGDVAKLPLRPARKYDLICANLISNLLIAERRRIAAQLNRGGTLVLAGILKSEFAQVQTAFENLGLKLVVRQDGKGVAVRLISVCVVNIFLNTDRGDGEVYIRLKVENKRLNRIVQGVGII